MLTRPFRLLGERLEINADASGGRLAVEILDAAGQSLKGHVSRPIRADSLRTVPQWSGAEDLSKLRGRTVRLRFTLENAKLYAFQVR